MKRNVMKARMIFALLLAMVLVIGVLPHIALAQEGTINCFVERPDNHGGDPGDPTSDPADIDNYVLYDIVEGSQPEPYLRTEAQGRRFAHLISSETAADGSINAYYARGVFRYEFDVFHELGQMTILDTTYKAADERYFVNAKYQQEIMFPGLENGLIPTLVETDLLSAYCAGWLLDERTGETRLLTHVNAVSESMLPTDDMPYENLTFVLTAVWFEGDDLCILSSWFEESPSEVNVEDLNRIDYNGKTYVNYPDTDVEVNMPKGSKPNASSVPGLQLVTQIEPDGSDGSEGNTWKILYDREKFDLSFDTGGGESLKGHTGVPYQHNLAEFDPGWDSSTTRTQSGSTYKFAGWFQGEYFISYSLADMYMPPFDLLLEAKWEKQ